MVKNISNQFFLKQGSQRFDLPSTLLLWMQGHAETHLFLNFLFHQLSSTQFVPQVLEQMLPIAYMHLPDVSLKHILGQYAPLICYSSVLYINCYISDPFTFLNLTTKTILLLSFSWVLEFIYSLLLLFEWFFLVYIMTFQLQVESVL